MYSAVFDDHIDEYTVTKVYDCTFDTEEGGRLDLHGRLFANRHKAVRSIIDRIKSRIAREQQTIDKWGRELLTTADGVDFQPGMELYIVRDRPCGEQYVEFLLTSDQAEIKTVNGVPTVSDVFYTAPLDRCYADRDKAAKSVRR